MKLRKRKTIIASTMMFCLIASASDSFYIVKKGDTLTGILSAKKFKRIYGKSGALAQTLKLNPKIRLSRGNKIFPNMRIYLIDNKSAATKLAYKIVPKDNHETELVDATDSTTKISDQKKTINERNPSDDFKQSFYWEASPSLSWKSLSSTDENIYRSSKVNALSNTNYGLSVAYGMHFEENIDIYSKLFLESVSFVQDSSINLLKKEFVASRFAVGISYERKWLLEIAMSDEFFLTSPSSSNIDIKKVTLPEIKTSYLKDFYQYREARLSYSISASAFLPRTSPDVKSELCYGAGGAVEAKLRNQSFKVGLDVNILKATGNSTNSKNIYWKYTWETL